MIKLSYDFATTKISLVRCEAGRKAGNIKIKITNDTSTRGKQAVEYNITPEMAYHFL